MNDEGLPNMKHHGPIYDAGRSPDQENAAAFHRYGSVDDQTSGRAGGATPRLNHRTGQLPAVDVGASFVPRRSARIPIRIQSRLTPREVFT
jgi:hypothetical protein